MKFCCEVVDSLWSQIKSFYIDGMNKVVKAHTFFFSLFLHRQHLRIIRLRLNDICKNFQFLVISGKIGDFCFLRRLVLSICVAEVNWSGTEYKKPKWPKLIQDQTSLILQLGLPAITGKITPVLPKEIPYKAHPRPVLRLRRNSGWLQVLMLFPNSL